MLVEYILIMVIVLSIFYGLMKTFNKGFRDYTNAFFGTYIDCLLDSAVLPNQASIANCARSSFQFDANGSLAGGNGQPGSGANGNGSGSGSGSNSNGSGAKKGSSKSGADGKAGGSAGASGAERMSGQGGNGESSSFAASSGAGAGSGSSASGGGSGRGGSGFGSLKPRVAKAKGAASGSSNGSGRNMQFSSTDYGTQSKKESGSSDRFARRAQFKEKLPEKEQVQTEKEVAKKEAAGDRGTRIERKRAMVEEARKPASKQGLQADMTFEFSFGNIFRWIMIISILLLVLLVIGGQLSQISKSMDK